MQQDFAEQNPENENLPQTLDALSYAESSRYEELVTQKGHSWTGVGFAKGIWDFVKSP